MEFLFFLWVCVAILCQISMGPAVEEEAVSLISSTTMVSNSLSVDLIKVGAKVTMDYAGVDSIFRLHCSVVYDRLLCDSV